MCNFLNTLNNMNSKIFLTKNGEIDKIGRHVYIET